jgi:hypothetical protein
MNTQNQKRILIALAAMLFPFSVLFAGGDTATIVGSWELTEISADGESYSGAALEEIGRSGETLEITEDGSATWTGTDTTESGTYENDSEAGTLHFDLTNQQDQQAQYEFVVDELTADTLTISIPDFITYSFSRQ